MFNEPIRRKNKIMTDKIEQRLLELEPMIQLGYMVAGVAHELKNPANIIKNYLSLEGELLSELRESILKGNIGESRDLITNLSNNTKVMQMQLERIQLISQGILHQGARKEGERESTSLIKLVDTYLMLAYHTWRAKDAGFNITFVKEYPKESTANVFPHDLGRAVLNVTDNALFTLYEKWKNDPSFSPILTISMHHNGNSWRISFQDNGMGMGEETRLSLFKPFFSTKKGSAGTGLGLFLTQQIIEEQHKGKITVESKLGVGTTIIFEIPG